VSHQQCRQSSVETPSKDRTKESKQKDRVLVFGLCRGKSGAYVVVNRLPSEFVTLRFSTSPPSPSSLSFCHFFVSLLTTLGLSAPHRFSLIIVLLSSFLLPTPPPSRSAAAGEPPVVLVRGCPCLAPVSSENQGQGPQIPGNLRGTGAGMRSVFVALVYEVMTRPTMK